MPDLERIGKYVVQRPLKRGGMGSVYLCYDPDVKRQVAVKVLRADLDPGELRTRFKREVAAVGGLRHRNIVTVFHSDEHEGAPFLVMEYIPGETLGEVIARRLPLPLGRKLQIVDELCSALSFAHQADIIHRDVKPANVMLDADGTVKVVDFGIARTLESDLTREGSLIGTLNYMAPEQMTGGAVDARTDVFAVGAVMYELVSYTPAFPGTMGSGLVGRILHSDPLPLERVCPDLPRDIAAIVMKAMHKRPEQRYQDMRLLRAALVAASTGIDRTWLAPGRPDSGSGTVIVPPRANAAGRVPAVDGVVATIERDITDCLATARDAITTGEFERAIAICRNVLEVDPRNTSAREIMVKAGAPTEVRRRRRTPVIASAAVLAIVLAGGFVVWRASSPGRGDAMPAAPASAVQPSDPGGPEGPARRGAEDPPPDTATFSPGSERLATPSPAAPTSPVQPKPDLARPREPQPPPVSPEPELLAPRVTLLAPPIVAPSAPVPTNPSLPEPRPVVQPAPSSVPSVTIAGNPDPPAAVLPPPPPPPQPSDRQMILDVLNRFADAMTRRSLADVAAVRQFSEVEKARLQGQFSQITSWRVVLTNPVLAVDANGRRATATTRIRHEDVESRGRPGRTTQAPQPFTVTLEKFPAGWMIVGLTAG